MLPAPSGAWGVQSDEGRRETAERLPRVLPAGWKQVGPNVYRSIHERLSAILSVEREQDGKRWLHVSLAHASRLPTWDELRRVKLWLMGPEARALSVLPPESEYVNVHPYCLHLWQCLDGDVIPDFRIDGQI